ncbi:flagellar hook-basal body protein [Caldisalinibacter kiritimatiensis]|uniref:Flagellar basal-body rod protein FlgG n=1 Tax=Caldisalinibacter kiritimatiensis TaxID=1304284 RepID=R1AU80_9FIRM|nr:flagellar hook-basal body protein [Caldisalinibacter kiritimatiensis]EOD00723.1 Flagellar basal-body rod protein FlgG [Caldisalinibacter kiritimatiensis]
MLNGLYTSTTSLIVNQKRMDTLSNNLANINTTGYKKDLVIAKSFPEMLLRKINDKTDMKSIKSFKGINVEQEGNKFRMNTQNAFFKVQTKDGVGYTKALEFTIDEEGYLRTFYKDGNGNIKTNGEGYILGKNGKIKVENSNVQIDSNGNVLSNGQVLDNLVALPNPSVIGTTSAGVKLDRVAINFKQGNIKETGNNLDFALRGEGFFKVHTDKGTMYTRDGSFTLNENGELITSEGHFVLGKYGSIIVDGDNFSINKNGEIIKDGQVIDKLDVVRISNKEHLKKQGNNLYKITEGVQAEELEFNGQVLQGYLENSNVDAIKEMTNMITLLRNYEASQKVMRIQDELLGKAVNDIARI